MNEEADPKHSTYTPSPEVPPQLLPRMAALIQALAGLKTVSQAARDANLSRNHFQTLMHETLMAMIGTVSPKAAGRPAKPRALSELDQRLRKLERENQRLKKRVEATDELIVIAGELLHGKRQPGQRTRRARKKPSAGEADPEPEPHAHVLEAVERMKQLGLTLARIAMLIGVDAATLRRWRHDAYRGVCRAVEPAREVAERAAHLVRDLHGLIGAAALSHTVRGLSRRTAARIKAATLTVMERERKARLSHAHVTEPGIVRGMDAMYVATPDGLRYALIAADACVPYRTALAVSDHYDASLVIRLLEQDIDRHGAPLVLRADRAKAHETPEVRAILERHQITLLHGPPRYPRFYGQLERQNREHRAWLDALIDPLGPTMQSLLERMLWCLNTLWRRPTLAWRTAAERWGERQPISPQTRCTFREEVDNRTHRIACSLNRRGEPADLAERLAIEQTLEHMGYLHQHIGARC